MFSKGLEFLTSFSKEERGALSIEHCLTGAATAVLIVASLVSVSPNVSRIYGGGDTVTENRAGKIEKVTKADQPSPGIFAHISAN